MCTIMKCFKLNVGFVDLGALLTCSFCNILEGEKIVGVCVCVL